MLIVNGLMKLEKCLLTFLLEPAFGKVSWNVNYPLNTQNRLTPKGYYMLCLFYIYTGKLKVLVNGFYFVVMPIIYSIAITVKDTYGMKQRII